MAGRSFTKEANGGSKAGKKETCQQGPVARQWVNWGLIATFELRRNMETNSSWLWNQSDTNQTNQSLARFSPFGLLSSGPLCPMTLPPDRHPSVQASGKSTGAAWRGQAVDVSTDGPFRGQVACEKRFSSNDSGSFRRFLWPLD